MLAPLRHQNHRLRLPIQCFYWILYLLSVWFPSVLPFWNLHLRNNITGTWNVELISSYINHHELIFRKHTTKFNIEINFYLFSAWYDLINSRLGLNKTPTCSLHFVIHIGRRGVLSRDPKLCWAVLRSSLSYIRNPISFLWITPCLSSCFIRRI